jgi:hypothetical protein
MSAAPPRPRPDPVRARRVLAVAAVAIVASQLATGLALDEAPLRVRFPQGAKVLEWAGRLGDAPYALLLGSSRFWGIDMDAVAATLRDGGHDVPVVKGAVPAGDAVVADLLLPRLLAQGSRPRLVVLEVSPETVARPSPWVTDHVIRFFTWRDVGAWLPEIVRGDRMSRAFGARLAPIEVYRRELLTWMTGSAPPYLRVPRAGEAGVNGLVATATANARVGARPATEPVRPTPTRESPSAANDAASPTDDAVSAARPGRVAATLAGVRQTRKWLRRYRADGRAAQHLERLVVRCRDAGVAIVLVGVPVSSRIRALYTPDVERAFGEVVERARRSGAEFLDYRARVPDALFKDHHHLNARGSTFFASLLASEVIAPRLRPADSPVIAE